MNNIPPELWGKHGWKFVHYITFSYPNNPTKEQKEYYKNFFLLVGKVLPCEKCRINYNKHLIKFPLTDNVLSCKNTLVKWLVDIHNEVNKMRGKKIIKHKDVYNLYFNKKKQNKLLIIVLVILVILVICYLYKIKQV
jgi:hypothetical protein